MKIAEVVKPGIALTLLTLFASCSQNSFESSNAKPKNGKKVEAGDVKGSTSIATVSPIPTATASPTPEGPPGAPLEVKLASFDVDKSTSSRPVDVVWVIDTPPSMPVQIAKTYANLDRFSSEVGARRDVKSSLLAFREGVLEITAEFSFNNITQLGYFKEKTNSLELLASAVCERDVQADGKQVSTTLCGKSFDQGTRVDGSSGILVGNLRPESRKVFVFVSNDNPKSFGAAQFTEALAGKVEGGYTVFAFAGLESRSRCNIANRGTAYEDLARSTGGRVFDFCEDDWSKHFGSL